MPSDIYTYTLSKTESTEWASGRTRKKAYVRFFAAAKAKSEGFKRVSIVDADGSVYDEVESSYTLPEEFVKLPLKAVESN